MLAPVEQTRPISSPGSKLRTGLRRLVERITNREIVHLPSGAWMVLPRRRLRYLTVDCIVESRWPLHLRYVFNSADEGTLSLDLRAEGGGSVLSVCEPVRMPCEWSLQHNGKLLLNGLPVRGSCADLLRPNSWVISQLELSSRRGAKLYRRLRHRLVDYTGQEADERYFTGDNYEDYDVEAAGCSVSILDELERYGEVKSLLDLGCATGILLRHAQQQGIAVAGIDSSAWAVERANAKLGAPVCRVADLDAVRAEDFSSHYDAVVMRNVIEHVRDPKRLVGLAAALLKPGGLVYCQTLNADSLMHNMRRKGWAGYSDYTHQSPWLTARWLRDAFSEAGFDMLRFGIEDWVWNEDTCDEVLREFGWMMSRSLAQQLLRDGWGDVVVLVARKA